MHQRHNLVAVEVGIGFRNAQANDDGSLANQEKRPVLFRDVLGVAAGGDDAERLEGGLFQFGFQILVRHNGCFTLRRANNFDFCAERQH